MTIIINNQELQVLSDGSIFRDGYAVKLYNDKDGYKIFTISRDNKTINFKAHRVVAAAFLPNPENKPYVNHKNGIKSDNRAENLEWVTASENNYHAHRTGLTKSPMKGIASHKHGRAYPVLQVSLDGFIVAEYECAKYASESTGVLSSSICAIRAGKSYRKTAGGYYWL